VLCNGGVRCKDKMDYSGMETCAGANLVFDGQKSCMYACLGFGDCVSACPFDAMTLGEDNIPKVDPEKCTACGQCVIACPKKIIELHPLEKNYTVLCSSRDSGAVTKQNCTVGCIACGQCVSACPVGAITLTDNLARIDPETCVNCGQCFKACPVKTIGEFKG